MSDIGQRIKQARAAMGLSQAELARRCGWGEGQTRVSGYENGHREPSFDVLHTLGRVLKCNPAWLAFGRSSDPDSNREIQPAGVTETKRPLYQYGDNETPQMIDRRVEIFHITDATINSLYLEPGVLAKAGVDESAVRWDEILDNSMDPVMPEGTEIFAVTNEVVLKSGRPYLVDHGGLRRVRLLYQLPQDQLRLSSHNRIEWPDEVVAAKDVVVLGRVFCWFVVNT